MGEYPINQSAFSRAIIDTGSAQKSAKFMWGGEGVLAVAGGTWLAQIAPSGASILEIVVRSVLGGLGSLSIGILVIFAWYLFRAPYKQRNEARALLLAKPKPAPLRNRESLIRAIGAVKEKAIHLKMRQDDLNFKLKRHEDPREELSERDNALFAYHDAMRVLETERLVAGDDFRSVIDNLIMFIDYHIYDCMGVVNAKEKAESLKTIPFMTQLGDNVEQAIRDLGALNLQVSDKAGYQT